MSDEPDEFVRVFSYFDTKVVMRESTSLKVKNFSFYIWMLNKKWTLVSWIKEVTVNIFIAVLICNIV